MVISGPGIGGMNSIIISQIFIALCLVISLGVLICNEQEGTAKGLSYCKIVSSLFPDLQGLLAVSVQSSNARINTKLFFKKAND